MTGLVWLVTGCSSGLGDAFVRHIKARGDEVIATARRIDSIRELEKVGAATMELDVTWEQEKISHAISEAISIHGHIDVLVNNAGYVTIGAWEDLTYEEVRNNFETNVFGCLKVTKAVLPHFRQRKSGTNVFIGSMAGWDAAEFSGSYCGTKSALEGMVESLWRETTPLGLRTLMIQPGFFNTELLVGTNRRTVESSIPEYAQSSKQNDKYLQEKSHNQIGDPVKAASLLVDVVHGEGVASGRPFPFRLAWGEDSYETMKKKCNDTLSALEEWKSVTCTTDRDM